MGVAVVLTLAQRTEPAQEKLNKAWGVSSPLLVCFPPTSSNNLFPFSIIDCWEHVIIVCLRLIFGFGVPMTPCRHNSPGLERHRTLAPAFQGSGNPGLASGLVHIESRDDGCIVDSVRWRPEGGEKGFLAV